LGGLVGVWTYKTRDIRFAAVPKSDELSATKETLLAIVKAPALTKYDLQIKSAALRRLAMFVDSEDVVAILLGEITFHQERTNTPASPFENYPAAQSLATGGATARASVLSVPPNRFLSDKEVALRARVLVAIDGTSEIAVYRLKQILERFESSSRGRNGDVACPSSDAQDHGKTYLNLGRILACIEDPSFRINDAMI
jgi:hypothetical protein